MSTPLREYTFVDDDATLQEVVHELAAAKQLAIDTEFVRERTYFPQLCVLQITTPGLIAAIDCLADIGLDALFGTLARDDTAWILHSARQDLEVLIPRTGRLPARLIDTQIGAAMLGFPLQVGLQGLLSELLGIAIGKEHTRIDWSRRPLADDALAYALDDVRYLFQAFDKLQAQLAVRERTAWFDEDCARQLELPIEPPAEAILERTKGAGGLKPLNRGAALALVRWREERARQRDRPRRWILADDQLVRIAAAMPDSIAALNRVDGLPGSLVERSGKAILAAVAAATPEAAPDPAAVTDKQRLRALQDAVRALADELGVPPELLATRRDLSRVAAGQMPEIFANGWRGSVLGGILRELSADRGS